MNDIGVHTILSDCSFMLRLLAELLPTASARSAAAADATSRRRMNMRIVFPRVFILG